MAEEHNDSSREEVMQQLKALGYIDPGAGSSMWQVILAGFLKFSTRLRKIFGRVPKESDEE